MDNDNEPKIISSNDDIIVGLGKEKKPKKKKKIVILVIVIIVLATGAGVGIFFAINSNNGDVATVKPEETADEKRSAEEEVKKGTTAILPDGLTLNAAITHKVEKLYNWTDNMSPTDHIRAIKWANEISEDLAIPANDITDYDSELPVYLWYKEEDIKAKTGTIYLYSEAKTIYTDSDFSYAFSDFNRLWDFNFLTKINLSKTKSIRHMLPDMEDHTAYNVLKKLDLGSVEDISALFLMTNESLNDISFLADWDVSNVKDFSSLFSGNESLRDISPLKNWDMSSAEDISGMFQNCDSLSDISPLKNWDTSNVIDSSYMFYGTPIENVSPLANWNVSRLEKARQMFDHTMVGDATVLNTWRVTSLKDKEDMFKSGAKTPSWY